MLDTGYDFTEGRLLHYWGLHARASAQAAVDGP